MGSTYDDEEDDSGSGDEVVGGDVGSMYEEDEELDGKPPSLGGESPVQLVVQYGP